MRRSFRRGRRRPRVSSFKRQRRKGKRYNSYRMARGGIRL